MEKYTKIMLNIQQQIKCKRALQKERKSAFSETYDTWQTLKTASERGQLIVLYSKYFTFCLLKEVKQKYKGL